MSGWRGCCGVVLESLLLPRCEDAAGWCEGHLCMPVKVSPNFPGPLSLARQPWMREILGCFLDPGVRHLSLVMGTQTGKTALLLMGAALLAVFDPQPMIVALPDDELADKWMWHKMLPFFEGNEVLRGMLPGPREIGGGEMELTGMPVHWTGARMPNKLAALSVGYVFMDEAAKFRQVYKEEAHPVLLLGERVKAFARRLVVEASTPSVEENVFWQHFFESDQRYYHVPCPVCGGMQVLEFTRDRVQWDSFEGMNADDVRRTARYVCRACGAAIRDEDKQVMLTRGEWRALYAGAEQGRRGYHLNSLYSAFVSFGDVAAEWWRCSRAADAASALQNFENAWNARPWVRYKARTDEVKVRMLRGTYRKGELPRGDYLYLVTAYDPGEKQTHWVTCMVCPHGEMYVIDWGTLVAYETDRLRGTLGPAVHLDTLLYGEQRVRPALGLIDSGDWTETIYTECDRNPALLPCKGAGSGFGSWGRSAVKTHPGMQLFVYSDFKLKRELYQRLIGQNTGELHLPQDADAELIKGLSGQVLVTVKGQDAWKAVPWDHYGDCVKLCRLSWWVNRGRFLEGEHEC